MRPGKAPRAEGGRGEETSPRFKVVQHARTKGRRICYAPRLPADPLTRSECIRSFVYPLRALQAPCLGTTLGGTHPQRTPPPGTPPPKGPPPTPPQPPVSPSGRLFRVDGYSKWMAFPSAWLFRGVLLQLNTRTCSDSVNAESIDCFGGVIVPSVQSQRGAVCKDLAQEHPKSSPGAPRSTPRAPSST